MHVTITGDALYPRIDMILLPCILLVIQKRLDTRERMSSDGSTRMSFTKCRSHTFLFSLDVTYCSLAEHNVVEVGLVTIKPTPVVEVLLSLRRRHSGELLEICFSIFKNFKESS